MARVPADTERHWILCRHPDETSVPDPGCYLIADSGIADRPSSHPPDSPGRRTLSHRYSREIMPSYFLEFLRHGTQCTLLSTVSPAWPELLPARRPRCRKEHVGATAISRCAPHRFARRGSLPGLPRGSVAVRGGACIVPARRPGRGRRSPAAPQSAERGAPIHRGATAQVCTAGLERAQAQGGRGQPARRPRPAQDHVSAHALGAR